MSSIDTERGKYDDIYARDANYGRDCFGKEVLQHILDLPHVHTVLDVGTGRGDFASLMADHGKQVWATDMCSAAVDVAGYDARIVAVCCALPGLSFTRTFDLVTAFDLLEHIPEELVESAIHELVAHSRQHVIASIAWTPSIVCGHNLHPCMKPREWWMARLTEACANVDVIRHKPDSAGMFVHLRRNAE